MFQGQKLNVNSSPHLHCGETTGGIMLDVIIALVPALVMSVMLFGPRTLLITGVSVAACILFEYGFRKIIGRDNTVGDLSAVVTGILLAFNLPATIPIWMVIIGDFVAIVIVKQFFGGIGQNFVNPALVGRIVLMISFPASMTSKEWIMPLAFKSADAATSATPLTYLASGEQMPFSLRDMFFGLRPGSLGEVCIAALLLGGVYLCVRRVISPVIPLVFMGTVAAVTGLCGQNVLYNLMSGGLVLGSIFMATDYTTCPINMTGKVVYAVGCGLLTSLIRLFGNMPEGVSMAIVLMNILVPHIERLTAPKPFGFVKLQKKAGETE